MEEILATCGTTDPLRLILRGGAVRRYHTDPTLLPQSVAEHTWRVMVLIRHLWPAASAALLNAALYHDVPEGLLGDLPAPVKRDAAIRAAMRTLEDAFYEMAGVPSDAALDEEDHTRLKCADYLELCMTCRSQRGTEAARVLANGVTYVHEHATKLPASEAARVLKLLREYAE